MDKWNKTARKTDYRQYFCLLLLFLLMSLSFSNPQASIAVDSYQLGSELYKQGEYGPAASFFEDAIKEKGANTAFARYLLGNCYVKLNRKEEAIKQYREGYRLNPKGPQAKHCLSALKGLYSKAKVRSRSTKNVRRVVRQDASAETARGSVDPKTIKQNTVNETLKKAYALEQRGRFSESERLYIAGLYEAEKLGSRSEHLLNSLDALSGFYMSRLKYHKAIKTLQRQLKLTVIMRGKNSAAVLDCKRNLAQACQFSGDFTSAREYYQDCIYGWENLFHKYERSRASNLSNSRSALIGAYNDMANFLNQLGDFTGSNRYIQLANSVGQ